MSDLDPNNMTQFTTNQDNVSTRDLNRKIGEAGTEMKQRAGEALQASANLARDKLSEAADAGKQVVRGTVDQIQGQAREQQRSGADFVERLAGNIRQAGRAFESDIPFAARGIDSAASYVEDAAQKIRQGSFRDLVDGATDFAKRQPAAFLGISVLAGFAAVRFLRASGEQPSSTQLVTTGSSSSTSGLNSGGTSFSAEPQTWVQEPAHRGPNVQQTSSPQGSRVP